MGRPNRHRDGLSDLLVAAFARRVRERFPGTPLGEEVRIARFACSRYTERVGALAGPDGYLDHAVELAVIAHLRHCHTRYEALLAAGADRDEAREAVRDELLGLLARWGSGRRAPA